MIERHLKSPRCIMNLQRDQKTGKAFADNGGCANSFVKAPETANGPKTSQLELIHTESEDPWEKTARSFDAVAMYGFNNAVELSKYRYEPEALDLIKAVYVTNVAEREWAGEEQLELYDDQAIFKMSSDAAREIGGSRRDL